MKTAFAVVCCAALTCGFSCPAVAQSAADPAAENLKRGIVFQSMVKTPDALDFAVIPYLQCVMAASSTKHVEAKGAELPSHEVPLIGCYDVKEKAEVEADKKLQVMGIVRSEDRKLIVDNTLLAIELSAQGNAAWMKRAQ